MITFVTAIYEEARPFIEILGLKKRADEHMYQHFVSDGFEVVIVGEGQVSALRNCSRHFALNEPSSDSIVINVGICGSSFGNVGDIYLINKIIDDTTGKTYYPDLIHKIDLPQHSITTVSFPRSEGEGLYDMEASMLYEGFVPYYTLERMFFIKVVSDVFAGKNVLDKKIDPYGRINEYAQKIIDIAKNIKIGNQSSSLDDIDIGPVKEKLKLTEAMSNRLKRIIYYRRLNGIDTNLSFVDDMVFENNSKAYMKDVFEKIAYDLTMDSDLSFCSKNIDSDYNPPFTNVYAEKDIEPPFECKNLIRIDSYKDIFNRTHQNFEIQKKSPALILSKQRGQFVYKGAEVCQSFGNKHFYYCSCMMNCIFDCEYCYLCGMYPSGNVVAFINFEDILNEIDEILKKHPMYLCISYDTDLLAAENMFGFVSKFIDAVKTREDLTIEIRTKSGNPKIFDRFEADPRVIFAWTLSPDKITKLENKTASLDKRLEAMKACAMKGFKVRVCFDPMLFYKSWEEDYKKLVDDVFDNVSPENVFDVSIGVFRISSDYLKLMRKRRPSTPVTAFPFVSENNVSHYGDISIKMIDTMKQKVKEYIPEDKIFIWEDKE